MVEGQGPCFLSSLGSPRDCCNSLYMAILRQVQESLNGRLQSPQRLEMESHCVCITVMKGHSWHLVSDGKQRCEGSAMHATAWPQEKRKHRRAVPSTSWSRSGLWLSSHHRSFKARTAPFPLQVFPTETWSECSA